MLCAFVALNIAGASANDSCKILFNKQVIFEGPVDQETAVAPLKAKVFTNNDCIIISYKSENANKGWERTFYINESSEKSLKVIRLNKQSGTVAVKAAILNKLKEKKQPVFIYTVSLPIDKGLAARIRVRRIFICKIEWN
jgi:hypothetical protein